MPANFCPEGSAAAPSAAGPYSEMVAGSRRGSAPSRCAAPAVADEDVAGPQGDGRPVGAVGEQQQPSVADAGECKAAEPSRLGACPRPIPAGVGAGSPRGEVREVHPGRSCKKRAAAAAAAGSAGRGGAEGAVPT